MFDSAEIATYTPQEKIKYDNDMTTERDIRNQIAYAEEKGIERGMEMGMEKGMKEGMEEGTKTTLQKVGELLRERGMSEMEIVSLLKAIR